MEKPDMELDALLDALPTENGGAEGAESTGEARPYDLTGGVAQLGGRFAGYGGMEPIHTRFAHTLQGLLGRMGGAGPEVALRAVRPLRFAQIAPLLPHPVVCQHFSLAPLPGQGLLVLGPKLAFQLVELAHGGQGGLPKPVHEVKLSPIEERVLHRVAVTMLEGLQDQWAPMGRLQIRPGEMEIYPRLDAMHTPDTGMVLVLLEATLGGQRSAVLLLYPTRMIDPIRARLARTVRR